MTIRVRRAAAADLPAVMTGGERAFGMRLSARDRADTERRMDADRFLVAVEDGSGGPDEVVGTAGSYALELTLPGGAIVPVPGVTWVTVAATHRRRGVLRAMLTEQHRGFVADGVPLAVLTASEGAIYGRFGYGPATVDRSVEIDRRLVAFRTGLPDPGGVRFVDAETARKHAPEVHRRWRAVTPGAVSRREPWWDQLLHQDGPPEFHLAHADGWACFRRERGACVLHDLFAATEEAHLALWRVLLGLDLVDTVVAHHAVPPDDPLPLLLTDPRQVRTTAAADGMWVRPLDVAAALALRTYAVELDVVLGVEDAFLDRGGRFRLRGGPEGATCERVDTAADVTLGVSALGSLLLGGHRAHPLARAGLLAAADPAALRRVDAAFAAERAPQHGTGF